MDRITAKLKAQDSDGNEHLVHIWQSEAGTTPSRGATMSAPTFKLKDGTTLQSNQDGKTFTHVETGKVFTAY